MTAFELVAYLGLAAITVALALIDLATLRLPNVIVLPSIAVFAALLAAATLSGAPAASLWRALIGAMSLALFYGLMWFFWPGALGFGDVKLALLLGMALGWIGWGALVVGALAAFICGGVVSMALIAIGRAKRSSRVAFGPSMIGGAWVGIIWGESLSEWYLAAFFEE